MAKRIKIDVTPDKQADKLTCVASSAVGVYTPPLAGECALYIGDDVDMHRQLEMNNGFRWLWNGIRDRSLLDYSKGVPGLGPIFSAAPIDSLVTANRLTSWNDVSGLTSSMIGIAVGDGAYQLGDTQMIESAFTMLREFYKEYRGDYPVTP